MGIFQIAYSIGSQALGCRFFYNYLRLAIYKLFKRLQFSDWMNYKD